jgi:HEPN domain-containing protein
MSEAEWLYFAREDLRVAELAFSAQIYSQACFHAQQCVEKALKAWLRHRGISPPRTHQLGLLISLLPDDPLVDLRSSVVLLDRFYILTRYPDAAPGALSDELPNEQDAHEALSVAQEVLQRTEQWAADGEGGVARSEG